MEAGSILDTSRIEAGITDSLFYSEELGTKLQQRINGISYQENEHIPLEELRYLRVLHIGFDGQTHIGELIVNASIAEDILEIMSELYKNSYPIEKMVLIDEYGADDEASMSDNNTSAFNYREIAGTSRISRHSFGVAIDINPKFNPYVKKLDSGETKISPVNGADYADRSREFEHKIDETDLCYQLFTAHGFSWGGNWQSVKDYQHFEK
ncbi:M15 family peptidase [Lachnospiraceae bacterium]|nr:M15 family peptidase [Lachnospiraceae bacterium]